MNIKRFQFRLSHLIAGQAIVSMLVGGLVLMSEPDPNLWYHRLSSSEQAAMDAMRQAGIYVANRFT